VGYVERTGIKEEAVPVRLVVNNHVLVVISIDDDAEMMLAVALHLNGTAAPESPQDGASKRYPVDEGSERSFGWQVAQTSTGDGTDWTENH
jgi:hypothetical protein